MPSIADTIAGLGRYRREAGGHAPAPSSLTPLAGFGSNPGALTGYLHRPTDLSPGAALVVVLHGCTQTAAGYDHGSGWSALADRYGFAVLFPEQQRANNPNLCFNWFSPVDTRRGSGEVESIRQMIAATLAAHPIDPARVFVTGLSAGGAMTSAMLATYPELFAGGAIIAGLPHASAASVPQAFERMRGQGDDPATLTARVLSASPHRGPWPSVSVWHGTADATVNAANAALIVDQWRGVHGVDAPGDTRRSGGHTHRIWRDATGRAVIEDHAIAGLDHGTPVTTLGDEAYGTPGPFMLEAGVSSTYRIAASWGLVPDTAPAAKRLTPAAAGPAPTPTPEAGGERSFDPGRTINDALRAAGLL